jgi:hypothetical protein
MPLGTGYLVLTVACKRVTQGTLKTFSKGRPRKQCGRQQQQQQQQQQQREQAAAEHKRVMGGA